MDLSALEDFNLVATHGGFGRASRAVGRPKATLSRRVSELEQQLGARLIERGGRSLRLTEEGRALHERTAGLLAELSEAGEAVASRAPVARGRLRVSTPAVLGHVALARVGARFALAHPQVQLELVSEDRLVDPVEEGYDLVIRVNPEPDLRLVGRPFLRDQRLLVARPDLQPPRLVKDAAAVAIPAVLLTTSPDSITWQMQGRKGAIHSLKPEPVLRVSTLLMAREAVLAGGSASMLPQLLVADDVASGRLACWGVEAGPGVEIWALYSSRRLLSAKVRAFIDALLAAFPDQAYAAET